MIEWLRPTLRLFVDATIVKIVSHINKMVALEDSATKRLLFSEMDEIRARIIAKTPDNPCARGFKVYAETDEDGKIHMWTAPACEGVDFGFGELVGCGHMSGPFARRMWPLALMEFADRVLSRMRAPDAL